MGAERWSHLLGLYYFVAAVPEAWRALDAGSAPACRRAAKKT
jgi:hypothetical protein